MFFHLVDSCFLLKRLFVSTAFCFLEKKTTASPPTAQNFISSQGDPATKKSRYTIRSLSLRVVELKPCFGREDDYEYSVSTENAVFNSPKKNKNHNFLL